MATYDKECDDLLKVFDNLPLDGANKFTIQTSATLASTPISNELWAIVIPILLSDGFVINSNGKDHYVLQSKGKAFIHTDSYAKRSKRWKLERKLKKQELKKLNWEVSKLKITYRLAVCGFILSIIALIPNSAWHQLCATVQRLLQSM